MVMLAQMWSFLHLITSLLPPLRNFLGTHAVEFANDLIWVDPGACCFALYSKLSADRVLLQQSPLALAKALKVINTTSEHT